MMRIPSGTTDQYLNFIAVDPTDGVTPETGFGGSGWTVYRSRNGATPAAYTTPTIIELDSTNMPGWYALLLDEDMTIGAGNDSEEVALHITHAGMLPARLVFELYRDPRAAIGMAAADLDDQLFAIFSQADDIGDQIGTAGAGLTAVPWNASWDAEVQSEVTDALNAYDPPTTAEMNARTLVSASYATASALATVDGIVDDIKLVTDKLDGTLEDDGEGSYIFTVAALENGPSDSGSSPSAIADEVQTRTIAAVTNVIGLGTNAISAASVSSEAVSKVQAGLASAADLNDVGSDVLLVKAKTDALPADPASDTNVEAEIDSVLGAISGVASTLAGTLDANIVEVAGTAVDGSGTEVDPWGPAD